MFMNMIQIQFLIVSKEVVETGFLRRAGGRSRDHLDIYISPKTCGLDGGETFPSTVMI